MSGIAAGPSVPPIWTVLFALAASCAHLDISNSAFEDDGITEIRCAVPAAGVGEETATVPATPDALAFRGDLAIDYDGAPTAYHPSDRYDPRRNPKGRALDWTKNAGRPGRWWALATTPRGKPYVQKPGIDPHPGFYVSMTSLFDPTVVRQTDPRRYVDATRIPFVVLPPQARRSEANPTGAELGDFAAVVNMKNRKVVYAIFADTGSRGKLGEGSVKLVESLGNTGEELDTVTVVFPGTRRIPAWPVKVAEIDEEGARLFDAFGGLARVDEVFGRRSSARTNW